MQGASPQSSHEWPRYWANPETELPLVDQGFLYVPAEGRWHPSGFGELHSFESIARQRCLVLLGEPGIGKSSALETEARAQDGTVLLVDLGSTRSEELLRRRIFDSDEFTAWSAGDGVLHVFLDSLDEATIRLGVVADLIMDGLRGADISRLSFRVACRSADRLPDFEARLAALWGEQEFGVFQLAPLRREDVRNAARDRGMDPDAFVAAVIERDIVPLAIKPVTLGLLLDLAGDPDGLPAGQLELYRRGARKLISEPAERRSRDPITRGTLSVVARLAIAERIAGAMLLSGRSVVDARESAEPSRDVVTIEQLAGGAERGRETAMPTPVEVNEDDLREVLNSGLFSARGGGIGWAHQTYGEYLAARYLVHTNIAPSRLLALADDTEGRIVPQLRDVAGWAAAIDTEFTLYLLEHDPLVLLRGEAVLTDEQRTKLVRAILRRDVAEELNPFDRRNQRNLRALGHPGLAQTLRERLADALEVPRVRELACELAALCGVGELEPDLLKLALDTHEPVAIRVDAVRALETLSGDDTRQQLIPLARDPMPEDEHDDLKGAALAAICPSVVSPLQALGFFTPEKEHLRYGQYAAFLRRMPDLLAQADLRAALDWVRRSPPRRAATDHLSGLAEHIIVRAAAAIDDKQIATAFAESVIMYLDAHVALQSFQTRDESDIFRTPWSRRRIVETLIPAMLDGRIEPVVVVTSQPRLIDGNDLRWAAWRLREVVGTEHEAVWADLVRWASRFEGADVNALAEVRQMSVALFELTRWQFGPVELGSELEADLRARHRYEQEAEAEQQRWNAELPDFEAEVDAGLDAFEAGDLDAYWHLNLALWGAKGDRHDPDLTASEGWRRANPRRRARIDAAARIFLRDFEPSNDWIDDTRHRYHAALAAYRALGYLAEIGEPPEAELLCSWLPAIVTFTPGTNERPEATSPLVLAVKACPDDFAAAARRRVVAQIREGATDLSVLWRLRAVMNGSVVAQLLDLWKTEKLAPPVELELVRVLLDADATDAFTEALRRLTPAAEGSAALATELLSHGRRDIWDQVWPMIKAQPEWGRDVMQLLANHWDGRGDVRTELSEPHLAELFIWLLQQFPLEEEAPKLRVRRVSARDEVGRYRDQVVNELINRGTAAAIEAISQIEAATGMDLSPARLRAAETYRLRSWVPPRPQDVVCLAAAAQKRVVLSPADLQGVLVESLHRLQEMLSAGGQAHQIWDTHAGRPKGEVEISAWIRDRLQEHLEGRSIILNREVEIHVHPGGGLGDRTDIHVDTVAREHAEGPTRITVIIEVKGCWHRELRSAMHTQLAERYIAASAGYGIYLALWFGAADWCDDSDGDRRRRCSTVDPEQLGAELAEQARALHRAGYHIASVVLDGSLGPDRHQ